MKFSFFTTFFFALGAVTTENPKRFAIVSEYETARKFYPEIRATKTSPNELFMTLEEKKAICRDIIKSHYIKLRLSYRLYYKLPRRYFSKVDALSLSPTKLIPVHLGPSAKYEGDILEWVFVCPVRRNLSCKMEAFYISEEYKIGGDLRSADNYVGGRFIFRFFAGRIRLDGIAEATAYILSRKDEEIEKTYVQRRITHRKLVSNPVDDPLCSAKPLEKIRICAAVFSADHFAREIDYPQINWVDGSCQKRSITFQTTGPGADTSTGAYEEWMMDCNPFDEEDSRRFHYFLSRAYEPNELFVYVMRHDESAIHLEGRATKIRFTNG